VLPVIRNPVMRVGALSEGELKKLPWVTGATAELIPAKPRPTKRLTGSQAV
jgi:hypothetical protein